jgi:RNA polymerase sigma-70 factor (ECF subfamily)
VWIDGMTQAEAAQVIGVSALTVERWLSRGLRLVTEQLADSHPGEEPPDAIQMHTGREWVRGTH